MTATGFRTKLRINPNQDAVRNNYKDNDDEYNYDVNNNDINK